MLSGFTPAQLTHVYGLDAIQFTTASGATVKGDGSGETIALVEAYHDPTLLADLQAFDRVYNLPDPVLTVSTLGSGLSNGGWALEESLDVEWAHAIAPGANLLVVEAKSESRPNLLAAVEVARSFPGVVAVSMSWGFGEAASQSSGHFTTPPGHTGITFVAASGDSGLAGGAEWPAVSPKVLAVGGTTLVPDASGNYLFEATWSGSGGGYSRYSAEPNYQRVIQATGKRGTPDVAFDGDPNTGVQVYETSLYTDEGSWQVVGGTSLGTPAWAAIIAIADQGRALAGQGSLDGPSQTLPTLYAIPSTDFHAIAGPVHSGRAGSFNANLVTGLGSPVGPALIADLVASTLSHPLVTSTARVRSSARFAAVHSPKAHLPNRGAKRHQPAVQPHAAARISYQPSTHPRESPILGA
jgi:hypothetical protein